MPKKVTKYRIFVASPADVLDERAAVKDVVDELNISYGNPNDIVLELVKWETHSAPGISFISSQDIINKDINLDYDLFIGIIWKRFGTATATAESGTEEEFNNAYEKYLKNPNALQILFYFKIAGTQALNEIDPYELIKIKNFKLRISELNALYKEFTTVTELQGFLRLNIIKRISEMIEQSKKDEMPHIENKDISTKDTPSNSWDEELGLLDYQEIRDEALNDSTEALSRITEATEWIGRKITEKADEINKARASKPELSNKEMKDFSDRVAAVLNDFANRLKPEIPIYITAFERAGMAMQWIIKIRGNNHDINKDEDITTTNKLADTIRNTQESMSGFLQAVSDLPRMSKELNKARRNVENELGMFISKLEYSQNIVSELKQNVLGS